MTHGDWDVIATIATGLMALAAVATLLVSIRLSNRTLQKVDEQLRQLAEANQASARNEHNWRLYEYWEGLPPLLSSWVGLSKRQFAWRVLIFNHLNLLKADFDDFNAGRITPESWEESLEQAECWFSGLRDEVRLRRKRDRRRFEKDREDGLTILAQVFKEKSYSKDFIACLYDKKILPA